MNNIQLYADTRDSTPQNRIAYVKDGVNFSGDIYSFNDLPRIDVVGGEDMRRFRFYGPDQKFEVYYDNLLNNQDSLDDTFNQSTRQEEIQVFEQLCTRILD
jgi:hypothetical protein